METIDTTILGGMVKVKQPKQGGLRVTMDTVFVAAACPAKKGDAVCDLGAGTGGAGLCVAARVPGVTLTFVEIQPDFAKLALQNAKLNKVKAKSFAEDIRAHKAQYDHIVCNPPYQDENAHDPSPDLKRQKAVGHVGDEATLKDWIACAARCAKPRGSLALIHRADALDDILIELRAHKFGAIEIWPLSPYANKDAMRVVIRAYKGRKTKLKLHAPIVLHESKEKYSFAATQILNKASYL